MTLQQFADRLKDLAAATPAAPDRPPSVDLVREFPYKVGLWNGRYVSPLPRIGCHRRGRCHGGVRGRCWRFGWCRTGALNRSSICAFSPAKRAFTNLRRGRDGQKTRRHRHRWRAALSASCGRMPKIAGLAVRSTWQQHLARCHPTEYGRSIRRRIASYHRSATGGWPQIRISTDLRLRFRR